MATETQTPNPASTFDYSIPEAPAYNPTQYYQGLGYTPALQSSNTYTPGTPQYNVYEAYKQYLGRAPENQQVVNSWAANPTYQQGIASSPEALTYGRARNEVNPIIDSQLRGIYDQIGIERQRTQSQMEGLGQQYNAQFGALDFGRNQQFNELDALRSAIMQDTDYTAGQLQSRFLPAQQAAEASANRRGLLNSTVALQLLNQGFEPIQRGLTDLFRTSQRQLTDADRKRQTIAEKYTFDQQALVNQREQEARALRDQLALLIQQQQSEANQLGQQRVAKVQARAGELGDLRFQQNIHSGALSLQQRQLQEQIRQFNENLALQKQTAAQL